DAITVRLEALTASPTLPTVEYAKGAYEPVAFTRAASLLRAAAEQGSAARQSTAETKPQLLVAAQLQDDSAPDEESDEPPMPSSSSGSTARYVVGSVLAAGGVVVVATSWVIYAGRQSLRLQYRAEVNDSVRQGFATRGAWTLAMSGIGASLLTAADFLVL